MLGASFNRRRSSTAETQAKARGYVLGYTFQHTRSRGLSVNLANCERIGTPGGACVSAPLPLRGRPPLQGGHYILPLAKGESRRRRQRVAHTRPHVSYTSFRGS